ncbi:hypothetical protein D3C86_1684190 [compost metagenome]
MSGGQLDELFRESYVAQASESWEPVATVTGWIWNKRMDDVMFVEDVDQYPNGALETAGEFLVRTVYPSREEALRGLIGRQERRIARAESLKRRLLKKLSAQPPDFTGQGIA